MTLAIATRKHDLTVQYLKDMTTAHLSERPGSRSLHDLLLYLATLTRSDALISRALTDLQASDTIDVGADHIVRLSKR